MKLKSNFLLSVVWAGMMLAQAAFAQQPAQPSGPQLPATTPPTFPQDRAPTESVPPDTKAPSRAPAEPLSTAQVKQQIQEKLSTEPELDKMPIHAKVNAHAVVLKGTVDTPRQHDLALRIVQSYAGER
jgi:hypothetical protein